MKSRYVGSSSVSCVVNVLTVCTDSAFVIIICSKLKIILRSRYPAQRDSNRPYYPKVRQEKPAEDGQTKPVHPAISKVS